MMALLALQAVRQSARRVPRETKGPVVTIIGTIKGQIDEAKAFSGTPRPTPEHTPRSQRSSRCDLVDL